jgi:hypothetical protein
VAVLFFGEPEPALLKYELRKASLAAIKELTRTTEPLRKSFKAHLARLIMREFLADWRPAPGPLR